MIPDLSGRGFFVSIRHYNRSGRKTPIRLQIFFCMDTNTLQNIVGEAAPGRPASIRFFGRIDEVSASAFNAEFDYLETTVRPSLIRVLINSEGGSVLHGMSVYSTIRNSSIPTECINEGMAASMASIVWAAGERSLMRDYGILMIHNPALPPLPRQKPPTWCRLSPARSKPSTESAST